MCTILFAYKMHPKYDLIFLGNRDEFKNRPSEAAHFWEVHPDVFGGIDLEKGGTWTGVTKQGRIAFLTNYRDLSITRDDALSRGYLTRDFLIGDSSPEEYLKSIQLKRTEYNPFNLVVGTKDELWFYSNIQNEIKPIKPGIYGLSNALLDTPWFKVAKAKKHLTDLLATNFSAEDLFDILDDTEIPVDEYLPKTGVDIQTERMLSSIYIDTPEYGTVFKTVFFITPEGKINFFEKSLDSEGNWNCNNYKIC